MSLIPFRKLPLYTVGISHIFIYSLLIIVTWYLSKCSKIWTNKAPKLGRY